MSRKNSTAPENSNPASIDPISLLWPRAMRIEMAAKYIAATPWAVEDMCRSGEIIGYKQGNKRSNPWVIDRHELDLYVTRRSAEALGRAQGRKIARRVPYDAPRSTGDPNPH
jgi:hypothetical protein